MSRIRFLLQVLSTAALVLQVACGGGSQSAASTAPTASISAAATSVASGATTTLTWTSTGATTCTGSGAWSGTLATSGTQTTAAITTSTTYSLTCTGAGGSSTPATVTVTVGFSGAVTLSPGTAAITQSQTLQYGVGPSGATVAWTVDGVAGGNAAVGTVNASGLYTPGTTTGVHSVVATNTFSSTQTASASVAVTNLAGVYSAHNDLSRDGLNSQEFALTPASVNTTTFGKLFSCVADGAIYAQPLWVANVTINGTPHNAVFVATGRTMACFAFDADASPCKWSVSLIDTRHGAATGESTVPAATPPAICVGQAMVHVAPKVGIIGTPVIDPTTGTLYVISRSVNAAKTGFYQRVHAIDVLTGLERAGSTHDDCRCLERQRRHRDPVQLAGAIRPAQWPGAREWCTVYAVWASARRTRAPTMAG